jgi:hypothetical protein
MGTGTACDSIIFLTQVVEAVLSKDLSTSLEPNWLRRSRLVKFWNQAAEGTQQGPSNKKATELMK